MRTAELIDQLAGTVRAVPPHAAVRRMLIASSSGAVVAVVALAAWLGVRPDLADAVMVPAFWMKWAFTVSLGTIAFVLVKRLSRPDSEIGRLGWALLAPVGLVGMMAVAELAGAPAEAWGEVVLGQTAARCTFAILGLAVPAFAALIWAFRRLAPTRLRLVGATAGLLAGAVGATVYVLTCPEHTPTFMVIWYDLGMLLAGLAGAAIGPRLFRW